MEDSRSKLQTETKNLTQKVAEGKPLTKEEMKILFLSSCLNEEENE